MTTMRYTDAEYFLMIADLLDMAQKKGVYECQDAMRLISDLQEFGCNPNESFMIAFPTGKGLINPVSGMISHCVGFSKPDPHDVGLRVLDSENSINVMMLRVMHCYSVMMQGSKDTSVVYMVLRKLMCRNYYNPHDPRVQMLRTTDLNSYIVHAFASYSDFISKCNEWERKYSGQL